MQPHPALIALHVKDKLIATVLDANRVLFADLVDQFDQAGLGRLADVFPLEVTI
jgi:hypothetical protein